MELTLDIEERSMRFWIMGGIALLPVIAYLDFLLGPEISILLFYFIPLAILSWLAGLQIGIATAFACAVGWLIADLTAGHSYVSPSIAYWNGAVMFGIFSAVATLITTLRKGLDHERTLTRLDYLTGAYNARFFTDSLRKEIDRSHRYTHPFTVAIVDLDNFNAINEHLGRSIGNKVLCTVARHAKRHLRKTDVLARLSGDEFALLMPETDQKAAQAAMANLRRNLSAEMRKHHWPTTFTIGLLTCHERPKTTDELIKLTDELLTAAKKKGRNSINSALYTG